MLYVKKTIEDADDFVKYVREDKGMADQIIQWSDRDLEEMYYYIRDLVECDDNAIDDLEMWDMLRFDFCIYKEKESNLYLDLNDFISDYGEELKEANENFDEVRFKNDRNYRVDCLSEIDLYTMSTSEGNIICRYY